MSLVFVALVKDNCSKSNNRLKLTEIIRACHQLKVGEMVAGETDDEGIYEPVSFWHFLRFCETERAGKPQHHLDCRVCVAATSC